MTQTAAKAQVAAVHEQYAVPAEAARDAQIATAQAEERAAIHKADANVAVANKTHAVPAIAMSAQNSMITLGTVAAIAWNPDAATPIITASAMLMGGPMAKQWLDAKLKKAD